MDPLSITASAITVAGIAASLCSIFSDIGGECIALPDCLHALKNEVQDLRVVLNQVTTVVKGRGEHGIRGSLESDIPESLLDSQRRLVALEEILCRFQTTGVMKRERFTGILLWEKYQQSLLIIQADIKKVKSSLSILLGISNSQDITRVRLDLEQALFAKTLPSSTVTAPDEGHSDDRLLTIVYEHYAHVEERLSRLESLLPT